MNFKRLAKRFLSATTLALALYVTDCFPAEGAGSVPPTGRLEETNSQEMLRTYLQLQEQLHATQLAIERNRQEADEAVARNAEALASRLKAIEQSLASQHGRELNAMQSSNRTMLIVAGAFAGIGLLAMLLMAWFQWRTVSRLAEIAAVLPPAARAIAGARPVAALGSGEAALVPVGPAEQSNLRLLDALGQLEKRIYELEHTAQPPLKDGNSAANDHNHADENENNQEQNGKKALEPEQAEVREPAPAAFPQTTPQVNSLLAKGQSLLNGDQADAALACFEEVLTLDPQNAEALVKKGTALERLRKLEEAIECYDRAIAADDSMTIAYLHKGGLFNRMERFSEAMQCYEQALRTQEKGA